MRAGKPREAGWNRYDGKNISNVGI